MAEFIQGFIDRMGYLGVFLFSLLEVFIPPLPEEAVFPFAGFAASQGRLSPWLVALAGTAGGTLSAVIWYETARRIGEKRVREWAEKHGKWLTLHGDDIDRMQEYFRKHGSFAVFIGRLIPGLRTAVTIPAGFSEVPRLKFVFWYALAAFIWSLGLTFAGFFLERNFKNIDRYLDWYLYAILGAGLAFYLYRLVRR